MGEILTFSGGIFEQQVNTVLYEVFFFLLGGCASLGPEQNCSGQKTGVCAATNSPHSPLSLKPLSVSPYVTQRPPQSGTAVSLSSGY